MSVGLVVTGFTVGLLVEAVETTVGFVGPGVKVVVKVSGLGVDEVVDDVNSG